MKTFPIKVGKGRNALTLDADTLVGTRALVQGKSGSGKSHLVRVLIEQTIAHKVQTIVFDPSGEFKTLREKCDVLIAGHQADGADVPLEVRSAKQLLRRVAETGISCVLDMSELGTKANQREFVRIGLETLHGLPRKYWGPRVIVVDECQDYAPESGKGKAQSLEAVITTASQGRKRGHCLIAVTQRLSRLSKDVSAECQNKFIGNTDHIDLKRAQDVLGCTAEERELLRKFKPGEFYAVGPALDSHDMERFLGRPSTTTHPKPGARHRLKAPPPSTAVKKRVLKDFEELPPSEEEEKAQTLAEAKKKIRELERELKEAEAGDGERWKNASNVRKLQTKIEEMSRASMEAYDEGVVEGQANAAEEIWKRAKPMLRKLLTLDTALDNLMARSVGIRDALVREVQEIEAVVKAPTSKPKKKPGRKIDSFGSIGETKRKPNHRPRPQPVATSEDLPFGWKTAPGKLFTVLIQWYDEWLDKPRVASLAGVNFRSSTFRNALTDFRKHGLIEEQGNQMRCTAEAHAQYEDSVEPLPSGDDLIQGWRGRLGGAVLALFDALVAAGGKGSREDICEAAGLDPGLSTARNAYTDLRKNGLLKPGRGDLELTDHVLEAMK